MDQTQVNENSQDQPAQQSSKARCAICGRPLSDPASIAIGIGPVCSKRPAGIAAKEAATNEG